LILPKNEAHHFEFIEEPSPTHASRAWVNKIRGWAALSKQANNTGELFYPESTLPIVNFDFIQSYESLSLAQNVCGSPAAASELAL
jgi:hypothetical protein